MPLASTSHHTVPHDAAKESEDRECENGISISAAGGEGIKEPRKVKIVLLVHKMWVKFRTGSGGEVRAKDGLELLQP